MTQNLTQWMILCWHLIGILEFVTRTKISHRSKMKTHLAGDADEVQQSVYWSHSTTGAGAVGLIWKLGQSALYAVLLYPREYVTPLNTFTTCVYQADVQRTTAAFRPGRPTDLRLDPWRAQKMLINRTTIEQFQICDVHGINYDQLAGVFCRVQVSGWNWSERKLRAGDFFWNTIRDVI